MAYTLYKYIYILLKFTDMDSYIPSMKLHNFIRNAFMFCKPVTDIHFAPVVSHMRCILVVISRVRLPHYFLREIHLICYSFILQKAIAAIERSF